MFYHSARPEPSLWSITEPNSSLLLTRGSCQGFIPQLIALTRPILTPSFIGTWDVSWVRQPSLSHGGREVVCSCKQSVFLLATNMSLHINWCCGPHTQLDKHLFAIWSWVQRLLALRLKQELVCIWFWQLLRRFWQQADCPSVPNFSIL